MLLSEIKVRDVVNLSDGNKIGRIIDLDIDTTNGNIVSLTVLTISKLRSFFRGDTTVVIPWQKVVKFGGEVIIVNYKLE